MISAPKKRSSCTSLESIAADLSIPKKQRTEPEVAMTFSSLEDDVHVELPTGYPIDFNFGELAHEFVSTPVPGNDMASHGFDSFFSESNVHPTATNETSEVSSEDGKSNSNSSNKLEQTVDNLSTSPINSEGSSKPEDTTSVRPSHKDSNQKRQADRAARNRESSRRAREKAKNRFRALENDNMALREMVRRFRMHNEQLLSQLDRANVMQQSCTMCRYNAAMAQQPTCSAPPGQVLRQ